MKKQFIYWLIIGALIIVFLVQTAFNQPSSNPKLINQNEIGRYQCFTNQDGSFRGFLDTKEGFVFLQIKDEWDAWDLKAEIAADLRGTFTAEMLRVSTGQEPYSNLSPEEKNQAIDFLKQQSASQQERIR